MYRYVSKITFNIFDTVKNKYIKRKKKKSLVQLLFSIRPQPYHNILAQMTISQKKSSGLIAHQARKKNII